MNIIPFKKAAKKTKTKGKTLCKNGFHKWEVVNTTPFDIKQGQLVNRYRCQRCGKEKTGLS